MAEQQDTDKTTTEAPTTEALMKQLQETQAKVAEYQTQNVGLNKRLEEAQKLTKRFEGIDPEKYKTAMDAVAKLESQEERQLLEAGKLDDVVTRRTQAMREDYDAQMNALKKAREDIAAQRDSMQSKLGELLIDREAQVQLSSLGVKVRKGALPDILARAHQTWRITDTGDMVAMQGDNKVFGKEGQPLKMDEWASRLVEQARHLFEGGGGGGAGGSGQDTGSPTTNDFRNSIADIASGKKKFDFNQG